MNPHSFSGKNNANHCTYIYNDIITLNSDITFGFINNNRYIMNANANIITNDTNNNNVGNVNFNLIALYSTSS